MRIIHVVVAGAVLALAGCSGGQEAETPEKEAALPPGRPAIYQAALEGPEPFVRALYAVYVAGGPRDEPPAPGRDPIYSRMMNAMIGGDFNAANGEVGYLNYDPICACQDQGDFTLDSVVVTQAGPSAAEAAVVFTNLGETRRQTLKLVREGQSWRIEDVIDAEGKPLSVPLLAAIEAAG